MQHTSHVSDCLFGNVYFHMQHLLSVIHCTLILMALNYLNVTAVRDVTKKSMRQETTLYRNLALNWQTNDRKECLKQDIVQKVYLLCLSRLDFRLPHYFCVNITGDN